MIRLYLEKIINNNVAQVRDEAGNQFVVMGRGLAFQAKVGQEVDTQKIEKIFVLQDSSQNFHDILQTLGQDEIEAVSHIIQLGEEMLDTEFPTSLLFTLGDHIHFAIERSREEIFVKNPLAWQVRRLYPAEFQAGLKAVDYINQRFDTHLDESEAYERIVSCCIHSRPVLKVDTMINRLIPAFSAAVIALMAPSKSMV